jgi:hypothetical protein
MNKRVTLKFPKIPGKQQTVAEIHEMFLREGFGNVVVQEVAGEFIIAADAPSSLNEMDIVADQEIRQ